MTCAIKEVIPLLQVREEFPITQEAALTTLQARREIHDILTGEDDRLLVIIGPCSIHDTDAALEYARRLLEVKRELADDLVDESFNINQGLRLARGLLLHLNQMGMPAATEYLDLITPQYVSDLIAWGAIRARTTESQVHRELASGLSCPVGFKNGNLTLSLYRCYNHFVVFRGIRGDRVLLADPVWGNRTMQLEQFEDAWIDDFQIGRVGFVVARKDGVIPANRLAPAR